MIQRRLLRRFVCLLLLGFLLAVQHSARAQTIAYNGYINKPTGNYSINFSLWNVENGGSSLVNRLWQTTLNPVTVTLIPNVTYGKLSVSLNFTTNPFINGSSYAAAFAQNLWIELKVGNDPPLPRQRFNTVIPALDVDRLIYVANALQHIDSAKTLERAAQAFFVRQVFADNPEADVRVVHRILSQSQNRFDSLYRSFQKRPAYRFRMPAYEATAHMLSILASSPGVNTLDPPNLPASSPTLAMRLAREAAEFAQNNGNWLAGNNWDYLETSNLLGRGRIAGEFNTYQTKQIEAMYDLARSDVRARVAVDLFFGAAFSAATYYTAADILKTNPNFRLSSNFAPLVTLLRDDGSIRANTSEIRAKVAEFQARMAAVFTESIAQFSALTANQTADYAGYFENNNTQQQQDRTNILAQQNLNIPRLQSAPAFVYVAPFVIEPDPVHEAYEQSRAVLDCAAAAANFTADVMESTSLTTALSNGAPIARAVASGLELAGATLDVMEAFGVFGKSNEEVIMDGINQLSSQLSSVQQQLNGRLDIIDANITNLYNSMNDQFGDIRNRLYVLNESINAVADAVRQNQASLIGIQSSLDRLTSNIFNFESQSARLQIKTNLLYITNQSNANLDVDLTTFGTKFTEFYQYAIDRADDDIEVGPALNSRSYAPINVETELKSGLPEWKTNYILEWARRNFVNPPMSSPYLTVRSLGASNVIVNPQSWEMSAIGLLRLSTYWPERYTTYTANHSPSNGLGFYGVRVKGEAIQRMAAAITLQPTFAGLSTEKSPLLQNALEYYRLQAENLGAVIDTLTAGQNTATAVNTIRGQYDMSGNPVAGNYKDAITRLNGAKLLLDGFVGLGLSRSLESVDLLSSLLYSRRPGNLDKTAQRLPDGDLIKALYFTWTTGENPRTTFSNMQVNRRDDLSRLFTSLQNGIMTETGIRPGTGEPLASVEVMLRRIDAFVQPRVFGTVRPDIGAFIPGEPVQLTFRYDYNSLTGTYRQQFTIPVFPSLSGVFSVNVPSNVYSVSIKAAKYLNRVFPVDTTSTTVNLGMVTMRVGDVSGDNRTNLTDLILVRNALGTTVISPLWNPAADVNSDGIVNMTDFNLVRSRQGERGEL